MSTPAANTPQPEFPPRKIRFPPFPEVPAGVTITPFKDFREHGIQMRLLDELDEEENIEKDGLGIPTIPLRVKHDTDISKTNPNRKRKTAKELAAAARVGVRKEWWEDWEEAEDLRNHGPYNMNSARVDRFHQAASDFQRYRKFPSISTNVQWLWDQFRIYSGLLGTTPVWQKASEKAAQEAAAAASAADGAEPSHDDFSDDENPDSDPQKSSRDQGGEKRFPPHPRPRAPYELYGKPPVVVEGNDEIKTLLDTARAAKEERAAEFLDDPARAMRVFLSSYMRNQGMVYADRNLVYTPHLMRFFVNYLLRNRVFDDDKAAERSLKSALDTIDAAAAELPLTAKLAKALPDEFSSACKAWWGRRADGEPEMGAEVDAEFESKLKEENVEVIRQADVPLPPPSADDDDATLDPPDSLSAPLAPEAEERGAAYDPASFTPIPAPAPEDAAAWENGGEAPDPASDWAPPPAPSLAALGLSALEHSHTPGVVEWSVRRVKAIHFPAKPAAAESDAAAAVGDVAQEKPDAEVEAVDPEAVERALEAKLARVVMGPWLGWDLPSASMPGVDSGAGTGTAAGTVPRILGSSRGAVVLPAAPAPPPPSSTDADPATPSAAPAPHAPTPAQVQLGPGGLKPHDPLADDLTLLLDPKVARTLVVGMGLGATWVQLARLQDLPAASSTGATEGVENGGKKKKLTKAQKERRALRYWYLDEQMMVLPSYWLA
ncbi:hypothetical protein C8F04DRAFT_1234380 [Mycena alexandri]|uniref:Uncharacterized protein n=1 Tax=Mycena alexandri TaxID=1745969 RepID=A0AAD6SV14_9AGAR|nr:hypothetical protein C8F04DRAFT_1234380 [Mycena alexandri]